MAAPVLAPLQAAIGPVILISGVGLLLLSMTNRFGRVVDRSRLLVRERSAAKGHDLERIQGQLDILWRRALLLRRAIVAAVTSLFLAGVLIIGIFLGARADVGLDGFLAVIFAGCILSLLVSLGLFLADLQVSLRALKLEMDG